MQSLKLQIFELCQVALGMLVFLLITLASLIVLFSSGVIWQDDSARMSSFAKRYKGSIAYVAVEYWLNDGNAEVMRRIGSGTAFLIDEEGRLLTNRHVACPWLTDSSLESEIEEIRGRDGRPEFGYRMWLWFSGARAFRQNSIDSLSTPAFEELYYGSTAYRSDSCPNVSVEGVVPLSESDNNNSDYAFLKVSPVPEGLEPLPLESSLNGKLGIMDPLLTLGFPLGARAIQSSRVVPSACMGYVRRSFGDFIQADLSMHSGASGSPVLNYRGNVVGIASSVCAERGLLLPRSVSDMSNILVISPAKELLEKLNSGVACWNGEIDPIEDETVNSLYKLAQQGNRYQACERECAMTVQSYRRLMTGVVLHHGLGNHAEAMKRLRMLLDIYSEHADAQLLYVLLNRSKREIFNSDQARTLLNQDWRSEAEFFGYLVKVLSGQVPLKETQDAWDTLEERALMDLVVAFIYKDRQDYEMAEGLFYKAAHGFADLTWKSDLVLSELVELAEMNENETNIHERIVSEINIFRKKHKRRKTDPFFMVYENAKIGEWGVALNWIEHINLQGSRQSARRLSIRLLQAQMHQLIREPQTSELLLKSFRKEVAAPWYNNLANLLLGDADFTSLLPRFRGKPYNQLILYTALGLKMEAEGKNERAIEYYRKAVDTDLISRPEHALAEARLVELSKPNEYWVKSKAAKPQVNF